MNQRKWVKIVETKSMYFAYEQQIHHESDDDDI
jgi:hypothetical protein